MIEQFNPFYCRLIDRSFIPLFGKIFISFLIGAFFLIPRLLFKNSYKSMIEDKSIILVLIIVVAFMSLYYATYVLKSLLRQMYNLMESEKANVFFQYYMRILRDKNFIFCGILFAVINTFIGIFLGVEAPYGSLLYITFLWGFFLAGFICGMGVLGIYAVLKLIHNYTKSEHLNLDFRAPDNAGGLQFIGNAILKFSLVIILTGILIAGYILFAPWSHGGLLQSLVKNSWILFPFIMAITITFSPIHDLSKVLIAFKNEKEAELSLAIKELEKKQTKESFTKIQEKIEQRKIVFKMKTIPLSKGSNSLLLLGNIASLLPGGLKIYDFVIKYIE